MSICLRSNHHFLKVMCFVIFNQFFICFMCFFVRLFSDQSHINLFSSRPQPKKKRKSRTAFTNNQIFELEKRFIYQKYLSPADRDEIAASLGLSNAQVRIKTIFFFSISLAIYVMVEILLLD